MRRYSEEADAIEPPGARATKRRIHNLRRQIHMHDADRPASCPDDLTDEDLDEWECEVDRDIG